MLHFLTARSGLAALSALAIFALPVAAMAQGAQQGGATAAAQPLTRTQLSTQLDTNFKAIDSNNDKSLTTPEIEAAQARTIAQAQATIAKQIEAEFARLDGNKDGQLSLTEFKAAAPSPKPASAAELLGSVDKNKDGKVSQDEYRATPLANFDRVDTNKDGSISAQERAAAGRSR